jgi:hypothetical protein
LAAPEPRLSAPRRLVRRGRIHALKGIDDVVAERAGDAWRMRLG